MASKKGPLIWAGGQIINPQQHVNFKKRNEVKKYENNSQRQRVTRGRGRGQQVEDFDNEDFDSFGESFENDSKSRNKPNMGRFVQTFRDDSWSEEPIFSSPKATVIGKCAASTSKPSEVSLNQSKSELSQDLAKSPDQTQSSADNSFKSTDSEKSKKSPRVKMVVENNKIVYKLIEEMSSPSDCSFSSSDAKVDLNSSSTDEEVDWCSYSLKFEKKKKIINEIDKTILINENMRKGQQIFEEFPQNSLIIHGLTPIPKPISQYSSICLNEEICNSPQQLTNLQSYMLTSILRGLNVCMIGTNLNTCYLPPICDLAMEKSNKYAELSIYKGPLIIVVNSSINSCETTSVLIKNVYKNTRKPPIVEKLSDNACDILITTAKALMNSLKSMKFNLQRLCHLVLDDTCTILDEDHTIIVELMILIKKMNNNRPHNKSVQFVLASTRWSKNIEILLRKLIFQPLICIDNYFEASLYGQVQLSPKPLKEEFKKYFIADRLAENKQSKCVIFCNDSEIKILSDYLRFKSFSILNLFDDSLDEDITETENFWTACKLGKSLVLICTDKIFDKLNEINDALILIHHSLPNNWDTVVKRFRCLLKSNLCPLIQNEGKFAGKCFWLEDKRTDKDMQNNFFSAMTRGISPKIKF